VERASPRMRTPFDPAWFEVPGVSALDTIRAAGDAVPPPVARALARAVTDGRDLNNRSFLEICAGAGGLAANIYGNDGTMYYMAHLDSFPAGIVSGQRVKQGDVVGFVGSSGNAEGGSPHVHLQIHPGGGAPVNPKPFVDRWISEAIANVPKILSKYRVSGSPRPFIAAGLLRRLDNGSLGAPVSSDGPQLWATSVRRQNGQRMGEIVNGDVPAWDPRVRGAAARAADWQRSEQLARDVLGPLTPRVLAGVLSGADVARHH
jgi:hypothetical protein